MEELIKRLNEVPESDRKRVENTLNSILDAMLKDTIWCLKYGSSIEENLELDFGKPGEPATLSVIVDFYDNQARLFIHHRENEEEHRFGDNHFSDHPNEYIVITKNWECYSDIECSLEEKEEE